MKQWRWGVGVACAFVVGIGTAAAAGGPEPAGTLRSSTDVQPYTSTEVQPYTSTEVQPYTSTQVQSTTAPTSTTPTAKPEPTSKPRCRVSKLLGRYRMRVPGTSYTIPGRPGSGTGTQVSSPGSGTTSTLLLRSGRRFAWGNRSGRFRIRQDREYPIVITKGRFGKTWYVGCGTKQYKADLLAYVPGGFDAQFGTKVRRKK
ncbi:hypothetical protein [Paraconexibacter sp.]|uniref:hypothetical protein n=1 Tax=Paraconexibacter sp. TaxID=2949640 RepID=UPI0035656C75